MSSDRVLSVVQQHGALSRADIARLTGLSKPTVSLAVEKLCGLALLRERQPEPLGLLGRPRSLLTFNDAAWYVAAVDMGGTQMRACLADALGNVRSRVSLKTSRTLNPRTLVSKLTEALHLAVDDAGLAPTAIDTVTIGLPGVVDPQDGTLHYVPNLPELEGIPLRGVLGEAFAQRILLDNDVNLAAYGQHVTTTKSLDSSVFVSIGTGLGVGVILNGKVHTGRAGRAGELGYIPYLDGTIEETVSGAGLIANYQARTGRRRSAKYIFTAAHDPVASEVRERFMQGLAWLLSVLSVTYDAERIFVGGGVGLHLPESTASLNARVEAQAPIATPIEVSSLGDDAALLGGIHRSAHASMHATLSGLEEP